MARVWRCLWGQRVPGLGASQHLVLLGEGSGSYYLLTCFLSSSPSLMEEAEKEQW